VTLRIPALESLFFPAGWDDSLPVLEVLEALPATVTVRRGAVIGAIVFSAIIEPQKFQGPRYSPFISSFQSEKKGENCLIRMFPVYKEIKSRLSQVLVLAAVRGADRSDGSKNSEGKSSSA
jgi:hypothetical protein